jgi:hypothetical protein
VGAKRQLLIRRSRGRGESRAACVESFRMPERESRVILFARDLAEQLNSSGAGRRPSREREQKEVIAADDLAQEAAVEGREARGLRNRAEDGHAEQRRRKSGGSLPRYTWQQDIPPGCIPARCVSAKGRKSASRRGSGKREAGKGNELGNERKVAKRAGS